MNQNQTKPYIVRDAAGVEYLLPTYPETFRALMDDKETIRDVLNSLLELDRDHEIVDLGYEFEKYIDVFMPGDEPMRLDVWVMTRDNRFANIELQNRRHPFFLDRMQLYNAYLALRSKHDYNNSEQFIALSEEEKKVRYYELPETVSIWICNFNVLGSEEIFKDSWAVYSAHDVKTGSALPLFPKNKYIVVDLPKFAKLRKKVNSHEDFWLKLLCEGPVEFSSVEDPLFAKALKRLRVSNVKPELLNSVEEHMFDEKHVNEAIMAERFLKAKAEAKAEGRAEGRAEGKAEGKAEGRVEGRAEGKIDGHADAINVMKAMNLPAEQIAEAKARLAALSSK